MPAAEGTRLERVLPPPPHPRLAGDEAAGGAARSHPRRLVQLNTGRQKRTLQAMKPPMALGMTVASAPPASIRSASPRRMWSAALQHAQRREGGAGKLGGRVGSASPCRTWSAALQRSRGAQGEHAGGSKKARSERAVQRWASRWQGAYTLQ